MAARNATQGKPATAYGAVALERLDGVRGATWIITARGREQWRERHLVAANEEDEERAHRDGLALLAGHARVDRENVGAERLERRVVRIVTRSNRNVERRAGAQAGKQLEPYQLAQPALETVSIDGGVLMTRHDDSDARRSKRGSEDPDIEMHGPNSLPLSNDGLDVDTPRQPVATRESKAIVRRLRTCSGA